MEARTEALHSKATDQVDTLIEFVSGLDDADLRRPCPGREKLGDGSVGTLVAHTAANYQRIAAFAAGAEDQPQVRSKIAHRIPRLGRIASHFGRHSPRDHGHDDLPTAGDADVNELGAQLATARRDLDRIAELSDRQLDSIPPNGAFRFCDGKRSLEEVLTALLTHQGHQVEALERG